MNAFVNRLLHLNIRTIPSRPPSIEFAKRFQLLQNCTWGNFKATHIMCSKARRLHKELLIAYPGKRERIEHLIENTLVGWQAEKRQAAYIQTCIEFNIEP